MADHELLESAAKSGGVQIVAEHARVPSGGVWTVGPDGRDKEWNPLADDGDALRLAVRLGIVIEYRREVPACFAYHYATALEVVERNVGLDPCAATRRAIVRAAAALAP